MLLKIDHVQRPNGIRPFRSRYILRVRVQMVRTLANVSHCSYCTCNLFAVRRDFSPPPHPPPRHTMRRAGLTFPHVK